MSVALVEGRRIGRGSTAASTALLMQEPDEDLDAPGGALRTEAGEAHLAAQPKGHARVRSRRLNRLAIACDLERRDSVYYAMTAKDARRLRTEHRLRTEAGIRGRWLEGAALRRTLGFGAAGAIRTRGNAQVDPYKASVGLIRAAAAAGAKVFERSPVTAIRPSRQDVVLETARGRIRADRVVIATGYAAAFDTLRPSRARRGTPYFKALDARFRMLTTYVIATRPLTPSERRRVGLDPVMSWDTERPYHYARWTPDHRLLLGGGDRPLRPERERAQALAEGTRARRGSLPRAVSRARRRAARVRVGRLVRNHPGRSALHRPAPPVRAPPVRARLRRQRDDDGVSRRAVALGLVPRRSVRRSRALRVFAVIERGEA